MHDQCFKPTQTGSARCEFKRRNQLIGCLIPPPQVYAEHPGETAHLLLGQLVLRMRPKSRIVDFFDARMSFKKTSERQRVSIVPLNPQRKRPQSPQQQPSIERAKHCPRDERETPNL